MTANTEVAKVTPLAEVCKVLVTMKPKFAESLPKGIDPDHFVRTVIQTLQTTKDQKRLLESDRKSLYLACQRAAIDGLMPDGRESAIVVFGTEAVFMPMTQGLVKLARNSGQIANIESAVVYSNDKFTYIMGQDSAPRHEADWFSGERGEPIGAWAVVTLTGGEKIPAMLSKSKIIRVAGKSKNAYQYDPNKGDAWEEWWKKTAIKNVLKYAPRSTALDRALEHDNEVSPIDITPEQTNLVNLETVTPEKPKRKSRLDKVKEAAATTHEVNATSHDAKTGEILESHSPHTHDLPPYEPGSDLDADDDVI